MRTLRLLPPVLVTLGLLFPTARAQTAEPPSGSDRVAVTTVRTWEYLVQLPEGYAADDRAWPLVVFLHGSGERGSDVQRVARHGPPKLVAAGRKFPFILVSPQCPAGLRWIGAEVDAFVEQLCRRYRVDGRRVYLTGLSMGGYGVWEAAIHHPARYAALVPVCGGGDNAELAGRLKDIPIRVFHGGEDPVVPLAGAQAYVAAVNAAGGQARLTVYPAVGHDSWTPTYADPELYVWLLQQKRP